MIHPARLVVAALLSVSCAVPALAAPACLSATDARAMQVRQLHIQLQVASLNCRADDPSLPGKYAAYVHRFDGALGDNARALKSYFARTGGGKDATRQMDRYVTVLANDESQRAHIAENYCEQHTPLFESLLGLKPRELEDFASRTIGSLDTPVCADSKVQQAKAAPAPATDEKSKKKKTKPPEKAS